MSNVECLDSCLKNSGVTFSTLTLFSAPRHNKLDAVEVVRELTNISHNSHYPSSASNSKYLAFIIPSFTGTRSFSWHDGHLRCIREARNASRYHRLIHSRSRKESQSFKGLQRLSLLPTPPAIAPIIHPFGSFAWPFNASGGPQPNPRDEHSQTLRTATSSVERLASEILGSYPVCLVNRLTLGQPAARICWVRQTEENLFGA